MSSESNDRFEDLLRDAAVTYNRPPDEAAMPLDEMWKTIERQAWSGSRSAGGRSGSAASGLGRRAPLVRYWPIAAALVVGVGIGRLSYVLTTRGQTTAAGAATTVTQADPVPAVSTAQPFDAATSRYLGQAAALLVALPAETNDGRPDQRFLARASELLVTTRLLLDSPTASEQGLRNLLEDLELVLVQVVRLEHERDRGRRTELELIQQALDQRDVLPRLRTAVSEHAADD